MKSLFDHLLENFQGGDGDPSGFLWNYLHAAAGRAKQDILSEMMRRQPNVQLDPIEQYAKTIDQVKPPMPSTLSTVMGKSRKP